MKQGRQVGLSSMAQQHEWLREKVGQLEQKIETQQEKIDRAIKDEDSQCLINSYKEMMARLVEEKKDIYQQLSALASPAREVLAVAP